MFRYEHVRLDLLSNTLSSANLARIERFAAGVCLVVSLAIAWYSIAVLLDTRKVGALVIKSLVFPEWWLFVPVPICFLLLAGECARRLFFPPPPTGAAASAGIAMPGEDRGAAR